MQKLTLYLPNRYFCHTENVINSGESCCLQSLKYIYSRHKCLFKCKNFYYILVWLFWPMLAASFFTNCLHYVTKSVSILSLEFLHFPCPSLAGIWRLPRQFGSCHLSRNPRSKWNKVEALWILNNKNITAEWNIFKCFGVLAMMKMLSVTDLFLLDDGQWIASRHPHINIEDGFSIVSLLRARVPGDKRKAQPEKIWRENHHLISLLYFGL